MVKDQEVASVLREIRARVRASDMQHAPLQRVEQSPFTENAHALPRLNLTLQTTERTWNKLPPLVSYRHGWKARLELWIKRQVKRATHWYTWEQVNFNAAVNSALGDMQAFLNGYEQQLLAVQGEIRRVQDEIEQMRNEIERVHSQTYIAQRAEFERRLEVQRAEFERHLEGLRHETRERDGHILDEQRVCLRQLSLASGETAVAAERARRNAQSQLDELARRVNELCPAQAGSREPNVITSAPGETSETP